MHFARAAASFRGELWTISEGAQREFGLRWIRGDDQAGLCPDPDRIHTGKNSGYQAIGLSVVFGAVGLVLLGFDMCRGLRGEQHWHGNHPKGLGNGGWNRYDRWVEAMKPMARDLERVGVKVFNASRRTALKCFPHVTLETAFDELRNSVRARDAGGLPNAVDCAVR